MRRRVVFCMNGKMRRLSQLYESGSQMNQCVLHDRSGGDLLQVGCRVAIPPGVDRFIQNMTEIKRAQAGLRESEERYRRLVELSFDAIYIHCDGVFVFANPAGLKLLGAEKPENLMGKSIEEFVHPDYLEVIRQRSDTIARPGHAMPVAEIKLLRADRSEVEVEAGSTPFEHRGKPAVQVIARDITVRKKMEAQLLRSQRIHTLGGLASGIAHDLNNILAPILIAIDLLRAESCGQDSSLIDLVESSAKRGAQIVRQLLVFGRGTGEPMQIAPRHLIREMLSIARETFPKSIRLESDVREARWLVSGDPTQLQQVVLNLCVNARDAMPKGGAMTLSLEDVVLDECYAHMVPDAVPGRYVRLCVEDTGTGIPRQVLAKIFDPFFTTKPAGMGTGLGLATVYSIVHHHGGYIDVYSEEGKGSKFSVYLPAAKDSAGAASTEPGKPVPPGNGELILLVDDETSVIEVARRTLQACGYKVLTANNGAEAVATFAKNQDEIKCVILDMMMPAMDGVAATRALRILKPGVKILVASGMVTQSQEDQLAELGIQGRLDKPFTAEVLLNKLHAVLTS